MKVMLEPGAFEPIRAHSTDAGLDIRALHGGQVPPHGSATFHTGVHIQLPEGTAGLMVSKSGLMMFEDITATGLVDEGYSGEVMVKLFNHGPFGYDVEAGDKIAQIVIIPVRYDAVEIVDAFEGGERGIRGFGSSGR